MKNGLFKKGFVVGLMIIFVGASNIPSIGINEFVVQNENQSYDHDVGVENIISPVDDGPGRTLPVEVSIKNYGQNTESYFETRTEITEVDLDYGEEVFSDDFQSCYPWPPAGWTRTHTNWQCSYSNYAGGSYIEAKFTQSPIQTDQFRFYTPAIDTSGYAALGIEFKHYVDHDSTPYTLQVETSADGTNWDVVWDINPTGNVGPETITTITSKNIGSTTYVSMTFNGDSGNIKNWYFDDIVIKGYYLLESEYYDVLTLSGDIDPGETIDLTFSDWTPEFLAYETSDIKTYLVKACTYLDDPPDENPANNCKTEIFTLDYWHDVGVDAIISPETLVSPGTYEIEAIVANYGTFPEIDLTASAEIKKEEVTVWGPVYISGIDLDIPLGGTTSLVFGEYDFSEEGQYELTICIPLAYDDFPDNNCLTNTILVGDNPILPALDFENSKGGLLGISAELKNSGGGTAHDIKWSMNVSEGMLWVLPGKDKGEISQLGPGSKETIKIIPMLGLGKITFTFHCEYKIHFSRDEQDITHETPPRETSGFLIFFSTPEPADEEPWIEVDDYSYFTSQGNKFVKLKVDVWQNTHKVRLININPPNNQQYGPMDLVFIDGYVTINENWETKPFVVNHISKWEALDI